MREAKDAGESLGYHLHRAFAALTEALNRELRTLGLELTHPQFSVLRAVGRQPGLSQNWLARETGKDGAAISRSLEHLERRGLIRRVPLNGCTKGVFLTQEGEKLRPLLEEAIGKTAASACRDMAPEEVETAIALLKRLFSTLKGDGAGSRADAAAGPHGPERPRRRPRA